MDNPKRPKSHRIETDSLNYMRSFFGNNYVLREQGSDYGIDVLVERFENDGITGDVFFLQLKGTEKEFTGSIKIKNFPVKTLGYALNFSVPFFLFYTSVSSKLTKFLWLQKYYEFEFKGSNKIAEGQKTITIKFPEENTLETNLDKIVNIIKTDKEVKKSHLFLIYHIRLKKYFANLQNGIGEVIHTAKICLNEIIKIKRLDVIEIYGDGVGNILGLDFDKIELLFKEIIFSNKTESYKLEMLGKLILPFKILEVTILSSDMYDEIGEWLTGCKPY